MRTLDQERRDLVERDLMESFKGEATEEDEVDKFKDLKFDQAMNLEEIMLEQIQSRIKALKIKEKSTRGENSYKYKMIIASIED